MMPIAEASWNVSSRKDEITSAVKSYGGGDRFIMLKARVCIATPRSAKATYK